MICWGDVCVDASRRLPENEVEKSCRISTGMYKSTMNYITSIRQFTIKGILEHKFRFFNHVRWTRFQCIVNFDTLGCILSFSWFGRWWRPILFYKLQFGMNSAFLFSRRTILGRLINVITMSRSHTGLLGVGLHCKNKLNYINVYIQWFNHAWNTAYVFEWLSIVTQWGYDYLCPSRLRNFSEKVLNRASLDVH